MHREVMEWQAANPGLIALRQALLEVVNVFLSHSVEWLRRTLTRVKINSCAVDRI